MGFVVDASIRLHTHVQWYRTVKWDTQGGHQCLCVKGDRESNALSLSGHYV